MVIELLCNHTDSYRGRMKQIGANEREMHVRQTGISAKDMHDIYLPYVAQINVEIQQHLAKYNTFRHISRDEDLTEILILSNIKRSSSVWDVCCEQTGVIIASL